MFVEKIIIHFLFITAPGSFSLYFYAMMTSYRAIFVVIRVVCVYDQQCAHAPHISFPQFVPKKVRKEQEYGHFIKETAVLCMDINVKLLKMRISNEVIIGAYLLLLPFAFLFTFSSKQEISLDK